MAIHRLLKFACPAAFAACLAAGFVQAGQWAGLPLAGLAWLAWLFAGSWSTSLLLVVSVAMAAGGVWVGASPFLMVPAATLALASWDLVRWAGFLAGEVPGEVKARLERRHYACLALAIGPALLVAEAGSVLRFELPFGGLVAVVLLALLGLDRLWRQIRG
jgi:hypothetical protein